MTDSSTIPLISFFVEGLFYKAIKAFTLAELLVVLAVLGIMVTFTIPKILTSYQNQRSNAVVKETMSMMAAAYQAYQNDVGMVPANFQIQQVFPYMNYAKTITSNLVLDDIPYGGYAGGYFTSCNSPYFIAFNYTMAP